VNPPRPPSVSSMYDWPDIDALLQRGLEFYGDKRVREAIECWQRVLAIAPSHPLAREYLEAAGFTADHGGVPSPGAADADDSQAIHQAVAAISIDDASIAHAVELVRDQRYEDALATLYAARASFPRHAGISRSIQVVKQRLVRDYRGTLGNLGAVPALLPPARELAGEAVASDERELLELIDGISTYEDVVQSSTLGALATLRLLVQLVARGAIGPADGPPLPPPAPVAPSAAPPRPAHATAPIRVPELPAPPPMLRIVPPPPQPPSAESAPAPSTSGASASAVFAREAIGAFVRGEHARARDLVDRGLAALGDADDAARRDLERLQLRLDKEPP
jgi:tetratricopeptide (TPR) repeat protein